MIQKGIIAQVIDKYTYKVRIPKYDKIEHATNSTKLEDLSSGIVCTIPGIDIVYTIGDIVLVSFENDEISKPIILGLLYRENKSDADISVSNVDSSLIEIQDNLNKINSSNLYTHIKYSNDNGLTFTSLFSPLYHESIINGEVVCQPLFDTDENVNGIKIDKRTRVINWSIIDSDNNDVTRNVSIETTVFDSNGDIIKKTNKDDNEYNITINNSSKIDGDLYLTYKLFITKEYLDTLHVLLATDREPIGTTPGDYIGISLSTNSIPSISPADYSWLSFSALNSNINIDINKKIAKLSAELNAKLEELTDVVYYKEVTWTQEEVNEYCQTGYQAIWTRDLENGYIGEIKEGSIFYISVHNIGDDISSPEDDSYGRLTLKASMDAGDTEDVLGTVIEYLVSGEIAINALARFKSDLLAPNDQTLIYGGHITTGHIQDYTGKNFIQLTDESGRGKAGHLEFKNADTWEASTSGLQWNTYYEPAEEIPENLKGTLSVKGDIYANSLTIIGSNGDSYSGTAAINIGGYKIDIEKNPTDYVEDVSVYLYPILYHNGVKLDEYIISSDIEVNSSKTYYEKISDVYEEIQDPDPSSNPHELGWYEKQIDYTHFIWYEDDNNIGTAGDSDRGKILAIYGHIYKVTYDFDDGAVEPGIEVQERLVDPSKYITKTGDESITVHPEYWENRSSYISLNNDGLNVFNSSGNSIAQYGSTARVGLANSSRFLMNSSSLEAYDSSNNKYFEVTSDNLKWGNNIAATISYILSNDASIVSGKTYYTRSGNVGNYVYTEVENPTGNPHENNYYEKQDIDNAAKTATNYITTISDGGIKVHEQNSEDTNYAKIDSNGLKVYKDSLNIASFGESARIGNINASNIVIAPDGLTIYNSNNIPAFSSRIPEIGEAGTSVIQTDLWGENYNIYSTTPHPVNQTSTATPSSSGSIVGEIQNVIPGESFEISIYVELTFPRDDDEYGPYEPVVEGKSVKFNFIKGTSKTSSAVNISLSYSTVTLRNVRYEASTNTIYYGDYSVTVGNYTRSDVIYSKLIIGSLEYTAHSLIYPQTTIQGNCCLNNNTTGNTSVQGNIYITPTEYFISLLDKLLWNDEYGFPPGSGNFKDSVITTLNIYNNFKNCYISKVAYEHSSDSTVDNSKTYYIKSESYVFTEVQNPTGNPSEQQYYERKNTEPQNYIAAHRTPSTIDTTVYWSSSDEGVFTVPHIGDEREGYETVSNHLTCIGNVGDTAILTCWIDRGGTLISDTSTIHVVAGIDEDSLFN